jgi:hypothetical protein
VGAADGVTEGVRVEVAEGTAVAGRGVLVGARVAVGVEVAARSVALLVGSDVATAGPVQAVASSRGMNRHRNAGRRRRVEALIKVRVTDQARF